MEHPAKKENKPPRIRRFSTRARILAALCALTLLAAAFVLLLPAIRQRFPDRLAASLKADLTFQTLYTGDAKALDTVTVTHADGETYTLRYRDQAFFLDGGDGQTQIVNESYTDAILKAASVVAVEDAVTGDVAEVRDYLADMGLAPPEISVRVTYTGGEEVLLSLGKAVPGTTYHYYRWSGDSGVYMCDVGTYEAFEYTAAMLLPVTQPTLVPALVDRLSLRTPGAGLMLYSFVADGTDAYLGTLREPYRYPMDSEATATLLGALQNFRLGTKIATVSAENRQQYGFLTPSAVVDAHQQQGLYTVIGTDGVLSTLEAPEQTIRLTLGAKDGEYFYFCEYAGECYRVSSFLVASLVGATPELALSRAPADMGEASIAAITVQLGDGTLDVRATYTERVQANNQIQTDEAGNTVYDVSVTANGVAIAPEALAALVARLRQMTVSGRLAQTEQPTGSPRWQMTITTTGGATRTLAAYPLDAFSDVLTVDGVALHYLNAEAIQIALADLYPTAVETAKPLQ